MLCVTYNTVTDTARARAAGPAAPQRRAGHRARPGGHAAPADGARRTGAEPPGRAPPRQILYFMSSISSFCGPMLFNVVPGVEYRTRQDRRWHFGGPCTCHVAPFRGAAAPAPRPPPIQPRSNDEGSATHYMIAPSALASIYRQLLIVSVMLSVRNIVMPIGAATATRLRCIPRQQKAQPSVRSSRFTVCPKLSSNLNISFRITSSGLVSAAPATPAATDLAAEFRNTSCLCADVPFGALGWGRLAATQSLTQMAHTYFGTVFSTDAEEPW